MNPQSNNKKGVSSPAAVLIAVIVVSFLAWLLYHTLGTHPDGTYRPTGFYERINSLIRDKALVYQTPPEQPGSRRSRQTAQWGKIVQGASAAREPHKSFLAESRRARLDVAQFNDEGPGGLFGVAEGQLRLNPYAHNFALPYPERKSWSGSLSFRGEELPTLAGENVRFAFIETDKNKETDAVDHAILPESSWLGADKQRAWRAKAYDLIGGGAGNGALVRLHVQGEVVFLEVVEAKAKGSIILNGVALNSGDVPGIQELRKRSKEQRANLFVLQPGDRLRVVAGEKEGIFRFGKFAGGMISRSWLEEGREINEVDPQLARDIPYVQQLHNSLQAFVANHPDPGSLKQPNVRLTFDRTLHQLLTAELESYLDYFDRNLSLVREIQRQPACITVMDALSGDVLAMPTYPSKQKLDELVELSASGKIRKMSTMERNRLEKNQNLLAVPIGSTTKPMLACAVWETFPALRKLVVEEPGGSMSTAAGLNLGKPLATKGPRTITPVSFLEKSSNAYTVSLYLATLADPKSWSIGRDGHFTATAADGKVDYSHYIKSGIIAGGLGHRQHRANEKLAELFDITLRGDFAAEQNAELDPSLLRPMFKELGLKSPAVEEAFRMVTSPRPNLALQSVDTVRGELVSMLVGGYTNRWPNVKLAEAYARVGTGRRVQMRVTLPAVEKKVPDFDKLDIDTEVLALVHQGMEAAVKTGTAASLRPAIAREATRLAKEGLEFRVIGKTGTARRTDKLECAAFCLYAEILPKNGSKPLAAVSTAIYLQDRAAARGIQNSAVAVQLASRIVPHLAAWLEERPAVREWKGKH
jgi:cell division protein FtsI/penicillin-binding protein 2